MGEPGGASLFGFVDNEPVARADVLGLLSVPIVTPLARWLWEQVVTFYLFPRGMDLAGLLLLHALQDNPGPLVLTAPHFAVAEVRGRPEYRAILDQIADAIPPGTCSYVSDTKPVAFLHSNGADLFAALHFADMSYSGRVCRRCDGSYCTDLDIALTDKYDFDLQVRNYYKAKALMVLAAVANNMAWSDQYFDVIGNYDVTIKIHESSCSAPAP